MIGQTLGHYRIEAKLGEGGMGVVYRAFDTHLDRLVAIKVLRIEAAITPERKRRFVQEAKAASALNHPNIIHIYDIDTANGTDFIAMEFVPGRTLDQCISKNGLPLAETLKYSIQIADGLACAHAAGIVHRDLKPANIIISDEGRVRLLDFGLAKLTETFEGDADAPTQTMTAQNSPQTEEGTIVGTVAYMSPEQAEGRKVDARSDIFSFGSVLYEMVTGRRAFAGSTKISTLSAILHQDPKSAAEIAPGTPAELLKTIDRCLRKDPARRIQHMDDVKMAPEELKEESESGKLATAHSSEEPEGIQLRGPLALGAALLVSLVAVGALWLRSHEPAAKPSQGPILTRLTSDSGLTTDPALSPAGNLFAYASDRSGEGNLDIWVKQIAGGEPIRLTHDPADDHEPSFSPDGSQIVFRSERQGGGIYVVSTLGGDERKIADLGRRPRFSPDGKWIAYWVGEASNTLTGKIYLLGSDGGPPRQLLRSNAGWAGYPTWAPDGSHILFLYAATTVPQFDWSVVSLEGGVPVATGVYDALRGQKLQVQSGSLFSLFIPEEWAPDGGVLLVAGLGSAANIWRVPISTKTWHVSGALQRLTSGAGIEAKPSAGRGGKLLFASLSKNLGVWSLPAESGQAKVTGAPQRLTQEAANDHSAGISADGTKLAFRSDRSGASDIWFKDLTTSAERRLTAGASFVYGPYIDAEGSTIAYSTRENQKLPAYVVKTRTGVPQRVCDDCGWLWQLSADGALATYTTYSPPTSSTLFLLDVASGLKRELQKL